MESAPQSLFILRPTRRPAVLLRQIVRRAQPHDRDAGRGLAFGRLLSLFVIVGEQFEGVLGLAASKSRQPPATPGLGRHLGGIIWQRREPFRVPTILTQVSSLRMVIPFGPGTR